MQTRFFALVLIHIGRFSEQREQGGESSCLWEAFSFCTTHTYTLSTTFRLHRLAITINDKFDNLMTCVVPTKNK